MERRPVPRLSAVMKVTEQKQQRNGAITRVCLRLDSQADRWALLCWASLVSPLSCLHPGKSGCHGCTPSIIVSVEGMSTVFYNYQSLNQNMQEFFLVMNRLHQCSEYMILGDHICSDTDDVDVWKTSTGYIYFALANLKSIPRDLFCVLPQPETLPLPSICPVLSSGPRYCDFTRYSESPTHPRAVSLTNLGARLCQSCSHDIFE